MVLETKDLYDYGEEIPVSQTSVFDSELTFGNKGIKTEVVTDKDIFVLGKWILLFCALVYVAISVFYIWRGQDKDAAKEVWSHAEVFLTSIISIIVGFYFARKSQ